MREIKFRAWWKHLKCMRYFDNPEIVFDGSRWGMFFPSVEKNVFLGEADVMQFTGLRDKNGKEIYEGDILEGYGKVVFHKEYLGFFVESDEFECHWKPLYDVVFPEIIGNIHENPELFK